MQSCSVTAFWATHFAYIFIHFRQPIAIALSKGLVHEIDFFEKITKIEPLKFVIVHGIYSRVLKFLTQTRI
jgi:hypothetical protein